MIYVIAIISSFFSGMGVGGGAIFITTSLAFNMLPLDESRTYNLLMFISLGAVINFKKNKSEIKKYIKPLIIIFIGCVVGMIISNVINDIEIKKYFNIFLLIIGIYEIFTSLINIKDGNNSIMKGDN